MEKLDRPADQFREGPGEGSLYQNRLSQADALQKPRSSRVMQRPRGMQELSAAIP